MKPVAVAIVKSGLVDAGILQEIRRWGLPVQFVEEDAVLSDPQQMVDLIQAALEEHDHVRITETDMPLLTRFLDANNRVVGTIVMKVDGERSSIPVAFCRTLLGEYVIPWKSEGIYDLMISGDTYLRYKEDGETIKAHFTDVREVFFGDTKAFMVCTAPEHSKGGA